MMNTPDDVSGILKMANDWLLGQLAQLVEPRFGCTEIVPKKPNLIVTKPVGTGKKIKKRVDNTTVNRQTWL